MEENSLFRVESNISNTVKTVSITFTANYGVPFVSKLKMMLVFTIHASIYDSCWYLRSMLVFTLHAGIVNTSMKCKYQHES